jgi:hypothetical protein
MSPGKLWACVSLAALAAALWLYSPALSGPFLFDDFGLPFQLTSRVAPLSSWVSGVRPVLMFSYWLNNRIWGDGAFSYHVVNVLIHAANAGLVFLILLRLMGMAGWADTRARIAAAIGAAAFLVHPLETESVSYVAGRSESLAALFLLMAYACFLYRRRESIAWSEALAVMFFFCIAVKTKENAVSLAGILVVTDLFWPVPFSLNGSRKNWRLYTLMTPGVIVAAVAVFRVLAEAPSAGFSLRNFTWYQYAFTEARAIFAYIRLALLPLGQSVDHDFPISRTITEHGALFFMLLLVFLVALAVHLRRRFPLTCFGLLMFLIWLAPTSSVVPVNDALVERRMYLALIGLILIASELTSHLRLSRHASTSAIAAVLIVLTAFCYNRNQLWGQPEQLFAAAAMESTGNPRPYATLADILIADRRCAVAVPYLEHASRLFPDDYLIQLSWGRALECVGRPDDAMRRLRRAAAIQPTSKVYELIGLLYGELKMSDEAGIALHKAVEIDPASTRAHRALALWYESVSNFTAAEDEYRRSLSVDRNDQDALLSLARVRQMMAAR